MRSEEKEKGVAASARGQASLDLVDGRKREGFLKVTRIAGPSRS